MPHYFFHLRDGAELHRDFEGSDLPNLTAARHCGTQLARTLIGVGAMEGGIPLHFQIEVHDERANICWTLPFRDAVSLVDERENASISQHECPPRRARSH